MILQALAGYYETLAAQGKIACPGWGTAKVSFALELNDAGAVEALISLKTAQEKGKKTALVPQIMEVPAPVKRSSGVSANFLCDNSGYLLGTDNKGKPQRSLECFAACRSLHRKLLSQANSPAARALLAFFDRWDPEKTREHPLFQEQLEELLSGVNLVFRHGGAYIHEDGEVRQAWQEAYDAAGEGPEMVCLVTGKTGPVEAVHPAVKGVAGAQSSGAALVSFNGDAFCSYGREQNFNAPTSKYAAFAYTTALNRLIADREHTGRIGDTTLLFWAAGGQSAYQNLLMGSLLGKPTPYAAGDLRKMMLDLCQGKPALFEETRLDPGMTFYILGLSPNAARLSVRFFLRSSFGYFLRNIQAHQDRLEIVRPGYDKFETIPLWNLLNETVNQNSRDKSPAPGLAGETLRAVLEDARYPATLLNGVTLRIRAEREVTRGRAAILKAYYLQNPHTAVPKEVLTVSLNPDANNIPYVLGRLFSVLEAIQAAANPGINATIKDKYFNAASATPGHVFPVLINLAQKHLRKLESGQRIYYNKQLTELAGRLGEAFPARLSLPQQGAFQLGYYHQTQWRYQKKEDTENG